MAAGGLGWLVVAPPVARTLDHPLTVPQILGGAVVCAVAAVLTDIDHPGSKVSRSLGPITWTISKIVAAVTGGHRHACHSLVGCAVFAGLAWIVSFGSVWFTAAVGAGTVLHLVADLLTKGGLPVLWPWQHRFALGWFRTGHVVERMVVAPVLVFATCWAVWVQLPR